MTHTAADLGPDFVPRRARDRCFDFRGQHLQTFKHRAVEPGADIAAVACQRQPAFHLAAIDARRNRFANRGFHAAQFIRIAEREIEKARVDRLQFQSERADWRRA